MPNRTKRPPQLSRFTLIELIVVLVVTMIIVGMGAGVASSLSKAGKPEAGVRILSRMIMLARQHAIASHKRVAVLVPTGNNTYNNSNPYSGTDFQAMHAEIDTHGPEEACVVLAICYVSRAAGGNMSFISTVQNTNWESLPKGVYIADTANQLTEVASVKVPGPRASLVSAPPMKAIVFKSNGSIEGATDIDGLVIKPDARTTAGKSFFNLDLNWLTGKSTIQQSTLN